MPWVILVLRLASALLLYLFLLGVVVLIWRDWRTVASQVAQGRTAAAKPLGRLVVVEGGQTDLSPGQSFPLSVITGLGRGPSNTVIIQDAFASTEHALLACRNKRWWLEDMASKNGTFLNGEPIAAPAIVVTGDEIGIGGVRLRIELKET